MKSLQACGLCTGAQGRGIPGEGEMPAQPEECG